jgi:hypothetical protein
VRPRFRLEWIAESGGVGLPVVARGDEIAGWLIHPVTSPRSTPRRHRRFRSRANDGFRVSLIGPMQGDVVAVDFRVLGCAPTPAKRRPPIVLNCEAGTGDGEPRVNSACADGIAVAKSKSRIVRL